jgi:2-methylisocitrate lyase-like PEP mutase family enzyme
MNNQFKQFKQLHEQDEPLLIGNVWDAQSAKVFERTNFKAVATSSAAVAATLGYTDGENMPFEEYFFMIKRIKAATALPLSVDLETGYGKTVDDIVNNIKQLHDAGIAGINIEDSEILPSGPQILESGVFMKKISGITSRLRKENIDMFINVRCDAFLLKLPNAQAEALKRITAYITTGVHAIFLPLMKEPGDIKAAVNASTLPVNVMCVPGLPALDELKSAGIKRVSMGPFLNRSVYKKMEELSTMVVKERNFSPLF